jgi:hypothetical protein
LLGRHPSEETRAKLRIARTGEKNPFWGKRHKPETIAKNRLAHSGPNHPGYRDGRGNAPYADDYQAIRAMIHERDLGICQHPGCYRAENGRQHPCHHIDRNKQNNHPANLILLCVKHHAKTLYGEPEYWMEFYDSVQAARGIYVSNLHMEEEMATPLYEGGAS